MKRSGNLFEQVAAFENIYCAAKKAFQGKRTKRRVAPFYFHLENEIIRLREELIGAHYHPGAYGVFEIREPKIRKICSSDFRDRVVHHAICNVLGPLLDKRLIYDSYACREGKGSHAAINRAQHFVGRAKWFLKCDIKKYFASIDHSILKKLLRRLLKDKQLLSLLDVIIDHQVPDNPPNKGIPIGNLTSQHFANFYLSPLDHLIKDHRSIKGYIRYMDDFLVFSDQKERLCEILGEVVGYLSRELQLELKETATRIAPVTEGVPFLGFRIFKNLVRLQRGNLVRFRQKIRRNERAYVAGRISEVDLVRCVSSMVAHVSHSNSVAVRRKDLEASLKLA